MRLREVYAVFVPLLCLLLQSCSNQEDVPAGKVTGSEWLEVSRGGSAYDVLAYPLNGDELKYIESVLPAIEAAAAKYPKNWEKIAEAEDPVLAAGPDPLWAEAAVSGSDVIAVSLKLTFLWEFASDAELNEAEMKRNLEWLEERLKGDEGSEELQQAANGLRALVKIFEAHRDANAFAFYLENQERIDAALDRFTAIGEQ